MSWIFSFFILCLLQVSLRTKYEQQTVTSTEVISPSSKRTSKWDKPKEAPPPPINRKTEDGEEDEHGGFTEVREEELPPSAMTKNLVSRFRSIESGEYEEEVTERKAVRKMTPPREEVEGSIAEYRQRQKQDVEIVRDPSIIVSGQPLGDEDSELPPPAFAKSMLARFKSMEDVSAPPPSPGRNTTTPASSSSSTRRSTTETTTSTSTAATSSATTTTVRQTSRSSPDSGICVTETQVVTSEPTPSIRHEEVIEGGVFENQPQVLKDGVVREEDGPNEDELPEHGTTKSLLAQWRTVEKKGTSMPELSTITTTKSSKSWSYKQNQGAAVVTQTTTVTAGHTESQQENEQGEYEQQMEQPRDIVRESDQTEEEYMPPPAITKNLLAKFQTLEAENLDHDVTSPVPTSKRVCMHNVFYIHMLFCPPPPRPRPLDCCTKSSVEVKAVADLVD